MPGDVVYLRKAADLDLFATKGGGGGGDAWEKLLWSTLIRRKLQFLVVMAWRLCNFRKVNSVTAFPPTDC